MIRIKGNQRIITSEANNTSGPTPYGAYHMMDNNIYEIQRVNNFEFQVTGLHTGSLLKSGYFEGNQNSTISGVDELIRLSVVSSSVPSFSQQPIEIKRGNSSVYYAGSPSFQAGRIVLNDYIGLQTYEALSAWQNLSYNVLTEKVGLAVDYKKEAKLVEYSPDYQVVRTIILYGCWITNLTQDEMSNEGNGVHRITADIRYDKAVPANSN